MVIITSCFHLIYVSSLILPRRTLKRQPIFNIRGEIAADSTDWPDTRKRKVAVLMGFDGSKFYGSQINLADETHPTVEGELWSAMIRAGAVLPSNSNDPRRIGFSSSSRTDRGSVDFFFFLLNRSGVF